LGAVSASRWWTVAGGQWTIAGGQWTVAGGQWTVMLTEENCRELKEWKGALRVGGRWSVIPEVP
jgi:hypothetical protein